MRCSRRLMQLGRAASVLAIVSSCALFAMMSYSPWLQRVARVDATVTIKSFLRRSFGAPLATHAWEPRQGDMPPACPRWTALSALSVYDDSAIHIRVVNGLGNRLRAVVSAIVLAQDLCRPLVLFWRDIDSECSVRAHDVIDAHAVSPPVSLVAYGDEPEPARSIYLGPLAPTREEMDRWNSSSSSSGGGQQQGSPAWLVSGDAFYRADPLRWLATLSQLAPPPALVARVEHLLRGVPLLKLPSGDARASSILAPRDCVGVHVRRGDHGGEDSARLTWSQHAPVRAFLALLEGGWEAGWSGAALPSVASAARFVVSSDDLAVHRAMQAHGTVGPRVVSLDGGEYIGAETNRADPDSVSWAAAAVFALSTCRAVAGSFYSTYSHLAAARSSLPLLFPYVLVPEANASELAALREMRPVDVHVKMSAVVVCGPPDAAAAALSRLARFPWTHRGRSWVLLGQAGGGPVTGIDADGCQWPYVNWGVVPL